MGEGNMTAKIAAKHDGKGWMAIANGKVITPDMRKMTRKEQDDLDIFKQGIEVNMAREDAPTQYLFAVGLRFYIASSLSNAENVTKLAAALKAEGHIHTYNWCEHGHVFKDDNTREQNEAIMQETAEKESEGVASADVVIVLMPGGKGTHVELGMALALHIPVIIASDAPPYFAGQTNNGGRNFPCAFWFHSGVRHHVEQGEVVRVIRELTVKLRTQVPQGKMIFTQAETTSLLETWGGYSEMGGE